MRWGEQITLIALSEPSPRTNEHGFPVARTETATTVFADKKSVGFSEFYKAQQAGYTTELKFDVHSFEYEEQQIVEYPVSSGKRYRVLRTYTHGNGEFTELTLVNFRKRNGAATMAKFNVVGLDDVQEAMLRQDAIVEEAVPEMLKAGGAVMQKAQQEEIKTRFNSRRSTGALLASIKVSAVKEIDGGKRVEIYPNGKDKHGVRNAEKGFVLNYGRSNMPARPWFTAANEKAADDVVSEMRRVWEEKQNEER